MTIVYVVSNLSCGRVKSRNVSGHYRTRDERWLHRGLHQHRHFANLDLKGVGGPPLYIACQPAAAGGIDILCRRQH